MVGVNVDHSPPRVGVVTTGVAAAVVVVTAAAAAPTGGAFAVLGTVVSMAGLFRPNRAVLGGGVIVLALGVIAAGIAGATAEPLVLATVGVALVWDFGEHAIGLGEQLTADADATRNVAVHAAGSVAVGAVTAGVGYGVFTGVAGGQPLVALFFLLAGAIGLAAALR